MSRKIFERLKGAEAPLAKITLNKRK